MSRFIEQFGEDDGPGYEPTIASASCSRASASSSSGRERERESSSLEMDVDDSDFGHGTCGVSPTAAAATAAGLSLKSLMKRARSKSHGRGRGRDRPRERRGYGETDGDGDVNAENAPVSASTAFFRIPRKSRSRARPPPPPSPLEVSAPPLPPPRQHRITTRTRRIFSAPIPKPEAATPPLQRLSYPHIPPDVVIDISAPVIDISADPDVILRRFEAELAEYDAMKDPLLDLEVAVVSANGQPRIPEEELDSFIIAETAAKFRVASWASRDAYVGAGVGVEQPTSPTWSTSNSTRSTASSTSIQTTLTLSSSAQTVCVLAEPLQEQKTLVSVETRGGVKIGQWTYAGDVEEVVARLRVISSAW